jgi:hypothetical protein
MLSKTLRTILETSADASSSTGPSLALLREVWPTLLQDPLCHRTRPSGWEDGTLTIGVASEQWLKEVRRNERQIHARIHRLLPWPVDQLEFVIESLPKATRPVAQEGDEPDIDLAPVDDDALQDDLERLDEPTRELMLRIRAHMNQEK